MGKTIDIRDEWIPEHSIFHMLAKKFRRRDVEEVYLAIQSAIAFDRKEVDVGSIAGKIIPEGRMTASPYCENIGASGLAFFFFLFHVELVEAGPTDYHRYRFVRRYDGAKTVAYMKTALDPAGPEFKAEYDRWFKKLDRARDRIIETHDWVRYDKIVRAALGDDIQIINLDDDPS